MPGIAHRPAGWMYRIWLKDVLGYSSGATDSRLSRAFLKSPQLRHHQTQYRIDVESGGEAARDIVLEGDRQIHTIQMAGRHPSRCRFIGRAAGPPAGLPNGSDPCLKIRYQLKTTLWPALSSADAGRSRAT